MSNGKWIDPRESGWVQCSECGWEPDYGDMDECLYNYCPFCGAKMENSNMFNIRKPYYDYKKSLCKHGEQP